MGRPSKGQGPLSSCGEASLCHGVREAGHQVVQRLRGASGPTPTLSSRVRIQETLHPLCLSSLSYGDQGQWDTQSVTCPKASTSEAWPGIQRPHTKSWLLQKKTLSLTEGTQGREILPSTLGALFTGRRRCMETTEHSTEPMAVDYQALSTDGESTESPQR